MKNLICPISDKRVNENVVRLTALWVVLLSIAYLLVPNPFIPLYLAIDFYIRAFTNLKFSPLSWISNQMISRIDMQVHMIDKAPKIFAARIGFGFSISMVVLSLLGLTTVSIPVASVLILFAFLECGLNFCAGCWVYTYIVIPLYRDK
ncbi:MAG: DUF4395 domain-containing protein [Bacteroidales bacterium]|jgi:hypothetical protein|nr:DUF4395 domain-containing protein [Bacteroidales bacterium]